MKRLKRFLIILMAVIMFTLTAVSSYAAPSPSRKDDYTTVTTDDGVEVTLWRMPDYLDKLSDEAKLLYAGLIEMAKAGTIVLYMGEVQSGKHKGDVIIMTSYPEKAAILDDENRAEMDVAYTEVKQTEDNVEQLVPEVKAKADEVGAPIDKCKVTEVFDLTYYQKTDTWRKSHDHGKLNVKFTKDTLNNFVSLLHRDKGEWGVVDDAKISGEERDTLTFSVDSLSPFAIVSWVEEGVGTSNKQSPKTGDNTLVWAGAAVAAVLMLSAAAYVLIRGAKKKRDLSE